MTEEHLSKKERKALKKQEQEQHRIAEAKARREAKTKRWTIIIISTVVILGFLAWLVNNAPAEDNLYGETPNEINEITDTDSAKGASAENAKLTIVEYSDFECPACAQYYPILKQLIEIYGEDVRLVYRHLPLQQIHPNATLAARYVEAAGLQGKFFEMHDLVFENQGAWAGTPARSAENAFKEIALNIGLDVEKLEADAESEVVKEKVSNDRIDGIGAGSKGTPSFFIDGELIDSPRSYEDFEALIQEKIGFIPPVESEIEVPTLQGEGLLTQ
jgi:protein-disulfide isomerase